MSVLLERGAELDRLNSLVRRAGDGQGAVAVIEGPPGIGKTRLGEEVATLAQAAGMSVLSAWGGELEQEDLRPSSSAGCRGTRLYLLRSALAKRRARREQRARWGAAEPAIPLRRTPAAGAR